MLSVLIASHNDSGTKDALSAKIPIVSACTDRLRAAQTATAVAPHCGERYQNGSACTDRLGAAQTATAVAPHCGERYQNGSDRRVSPVCTENAGILSPSTDTQ
jgi:hypothetical protein